MALSRITNYIEADGADLNLQSSDTTITASSVLGVINFKAPSEASGTDAILLASKIEAVAEGTFSASSNATKLSFATASSEAASEKMSLSSAGLLTVSGRIITDDTTEATSTTDGSLQTDGGLSVAKDIGAGDDVKLLSDSAVLSFGADSEIQLIHVADDGLILKHVGTGDGKEPSLTFQAGDNDIAQDDVLGSIFFQAPDEGAGTDAILVAAGIEAVSEGDFSASSNATSLVFKTGASETATAKWAITSGGSFLNQGTNTIDMNAGELILDADADTSITADTDDHIDIKVGGTDTIKLEPDVVTILGPHPDLNLQDSDDNNVGGVFYNNGRITLASDNGAQHDSSTLVLSVDGTARVTVDSGGDVDIETGDIFFSTADKGINLGVTSNTDSNTLDDYEEGTFTLSVGTNYSGTYSSIQYTYYTKVGNQVFYGMRISGRSNTSDSSQVNFTGFPFAVYAEHAAAVGMNDDEFGHAMVNTAETLYFYNLTGGDFQYSQWPHTSGYARVTGSYRIA